jgi:hypothetical protein
MYVVVSLENLKKKKKKKHFITTIDEKSGRYSLKSRGATVPINGWDKMVQEPTEHDEEDSTNER